ncbi:OmpA family protein [Sphingobacterium sp. HJSM2_6]|uniref:OmpA family protein n=1 Tax=Sphingobacterium sp. HJSM2_6 TaxID=3366264 RepID=UPI003BC3F463
MTSISLFKQLLTIGFCLFVSISFAQPGSVNKKAQKAFENANRALAANKLAEAKDLLHIAILADANFATAYQQLGDILRKEEHYANAIPYYEKVLQINPELSPLTQFGLASCLFFSGKYEEALKYFSSYKKLLNPNAASVELLNKYLIDCEFALANSEPTKNIHLIPISPEINSSHDEYFPKLTANNQNIIFTRKEANQENFYSSTKINGKWTSVEKLPEPINTAVYNEGAHCISLDGKQLYFTGCNRPNGLGSCDIYVSNLESGRWTTATNLGPAINSKGWEAQPAISADGKTLYFVSNRVGGYGGNDLWMSQLQADGTWSKAINLGNKINSKYDEGSPYIHADNKTLYFTSNGWPGYGKNDIFQSERQEDGQWNAAKNLGKPINNELDQRSFNISLDGKTGYLASQDSSRNWDIYTASIPLEIAPSSVAYIEGIILNQANKHPLGATIRVTNTKNNKRIFEASSDHIDGTFLALLPIGQNYAVHVKKEGFLFHSKQYDLTNLAQSESNFQDSIYLEPIQKGSISILRNIYFNSNEYQILPDSETDLNLLKEFLELNPKLIITIEGHTDHTGNSQNNQVLSEQRAAEVAKMLIQKGINKDRIQTKGYGDSKPIDTNDTEKGKQANRRTSFRIL